MKPYPGKDLSDDKVSFNYRLSRARRTSENAFEILAGRFQVLKNPIHTSPDNVKDIILATAVLHNYLRTHADRENSVQCTNRNRGDWYDQSQNGGLQPLAAIGRGHSNEAKVVRENLVAYFNNEGSVSWQNDMVHMH